MNLFEKVLCGKNIEVLGYVFCTISIIGFSEQRTEEEQVREERWKERV